MNRDQTQVVLGLVRELGKVRTADDTALAPAYVRQKAWPANAERVTPRQIRKEFASRVGLPVLLDINLLKETIKLGIKAGQWLYFDPGKGCAYSNESPTSPLVEITDDVELILPEAAAGVPICGKEEPPPTATAKGKCLLCKNPHDACTCSIGFPGPGSGGPTGALIGKGSPSRAFQRVVDLAQEQKVSALTTVEIRAAGEGHELGLDLQAMALAVPQLPKADRRVEVEGAFDLPEDDRLQIKFQGSWDRYRRLNETVRKAAKDARSATGHITLRLTFPNPVNPTGTELGSIRDTFVRISPGHIRVVATPVPPQ